MLELDDLLDRRLLDMVPERCERINVGKRGGRQSATQDEIHNLLTDRAQKGQVVVRLKGGDPLIFGRGGEEALHLRATDIPFEIVSGVSAAAGVPAYAGIPLTHRGIASATLLVTGNEDPTKPDTTIDWTLLAAFKGTLVIFMATRKLTDICQTLIAKGRPASTPAAIIEWGTWPEQRTVACDLQNLPAEADKSAIRSPALIVIGEVVSLRQMLNWYESKPLFGRRLLVTRSREQAGPLQRRLEAEGAAVSALPLLVRGAGRVGWSKSQVQRSAVHTESSSLSAVARNSGIRSHEYTSTRAQSARAHECTRAECALFTHASCVRRTMRARLASHAHAHTRLRVTRAGRDA